MTMTVTHREAYAYMAWRRNPERDPSYRLQTEGEAMEQAQRLAQRRPGSTYIVLKEVARVTFNPIPAATPPGGRESRAIIAPRSPGSKGGA